MILRDVNFVTSAAGVA